MSSVESMSTNVSGSQGQDEAVEAGEYVDAIMGSQTVASVADTTSPITRKRHLSLPDQNEKSCKKVRGESTSSSERVLAQARRSLYGSTPAAKGANSTRKRQENPSQERSNESTDAIDHEEQNPSVTELLHRIAGDLKQLTGRISGLEQTLEDRHQLLSDRIDQMESRLEKKLSDRVAQIIDKRVNSEIKRLQKDIDTRISDIRSDLQSDVTDLSAKLESVSESVCSRGQSSDVAVNVVIRDLPDHNGENTLAKVNNLFRDNLKLRDVSAKSAVRKPSSNAKPGVVIATLESTEDKHKVLKAKSLLRHSGMKKVFIHPDQSRSERLQHANLRAIVDAINNAGPAISLRGNRVVRSNDDSSRQDSRDRRVPSGRHSNDRNEAGEGRSGNPGGSNRGGHRSLFRRNQSHQGGARGSGRPNTRNANRN